MGQGGLPAVSLKEEKFVVVEVPDVCLICMQGRRKGYCGPVVHGGFLLPSLNINTSVVILRAGTAVFNVTLYFAQETRMSMQAFVSCWIRVRLLTFEKSQESGLVIKASEEKKVELQGLKWHRGCTVV